MKTPQAFGLAGLAFAASIAAAAPVYAQTAPGTVCNAENVKFYLSTDYLPFRTSEIDVDRFIATFEKTRFEYYNLATGKWQSFAPLMATTTDPAEREKMRAGIAAILIYWNQHKELREDFWLAYVLGTAFHETAQKMYPVREGLKDNDADSIAYLEAAHKKKGSGPVYWRDTPSYFGRGYVQITWDWNYQQADEQLGRTKMPASQRFLTNPSLALEVDHSTMITWDGMIDGWFSQSNCLLRYFLPGRKPKWKDARRIINGWDKWETIASYSDTFLKLIETSSVPAR